MAKPKTYILTHYKKMNTSFSVNGREIEVLFKAPANIGKGQYSTDDPDLQKAIESSKSYGKDFITKKEVEDNFHVGNFNEILDMQENSIKLQKKVISQANVISEKVSEIQKLNEENQKLKSIITERDEKITVLEAELQRVTGKNKTVEETTDDTDNLDIDGGDEVDGSGKIDNSNEVSSEDSGNVENSGEEIKDTAPKVYPDIKNGQQAAGILCENHQGKITHLNSNAKIIEYAKEKNVTFPDWPAFNS